MNALLQFLRDSAPSPGAGDKSVGFPVVGDGQDLCACFLSEWAEATGLVISLYDVTGQRVAGPYATGPLGLILSPILSEPATIAALWEKELVVSVGKSQFPREQEFESILDVIAQPIGAEGHPQAVLTLGWCFSGFPDPMQCERLASVFGLEHKLLWLAARSHLPVPKSRLQLYQRMMRTSLEGMLSQARLRSKESSVTNIFAGLTHLLSDINGCGTNESLATALAKNCRLISGAEFVRLTLGSSDESGEAVFEGNPPTSGTSRHVLEPVTDRSGNQIGVIEFVFPENVTFFFPEPLRRVIATQISLVVERLETLCQLQVEKEQLRKTSEELRSLNARLEQFTSIASHDLQAPLRNMRICAQLLKREATSSTPKASEYLDFIESGSLRLTQLVTEFLRFAQSNRTFELSESFELREAVDLGMADHDFSISNETTVIGELPSVRGNKILLSQVFKNLIGNAMKYAGEEDLRIEISSVKNASTYRICVADNGAGIASEHLRRIFEPFFRINPGKAEGFGLGLPLCKQIIERHGGEMWAESTEGLGSRFYFTLPFEGERGLERLANTQAEKAFQ